MITTACPFCFHYIDTSKLAYQCAGRGEKKCVKSVDEERVKHTGIKSETYPTFRRTGQNGVRPDMCPTCDHIAKRRACPVCHTVLPIDFVDSASPVIGLVGFRGSGKTVLMTALIKQLRLSVGLRFGASVHITNDNPDSMSGLSKYATAREMSLFNDGILPPYTRKRGEENHAAPVMMQWQTSKRQFGRDVTQSLFLSFIDTAGEDLNDLETVFTLQYLSVCDSLIITVDPFCLPGAAAGLNLPPAATEHVDIEDAPMAVLSRLTELLRVEKNVKKNKKVRLPIAIVFTKIDAFYPTLDRGSPIMARPAEVPSYQMQDGAAVHEHMLALLHRWDAADIDNHLRLNYSDYRYFGVSALGAEPDYANQQVSPGGVRPHRVEDPVLWILAKLGKVPTA